MRVRAAALAVGITIAGASAWAAEPTKGGADLARGEKIAAEVCAACHGPDGNSPLPENPKLAAQVAAYTAKQLADFKADKTRKSPIMSPMATPLSEADMKAVAAHYAAQKPRVGEAHDKATVSMGEKLYRGGNAATGVPACSGCHGPAGAGVPAQYPRLSGQHAQYTTAQLRAFRSDERSNDPNQIMRQIAARMSDREIAAVADYIAGLH
ncbi:MAG: cytochrome c4 [Burkholderiales bacterium]|nr:cytochrome c4 [Burkholderiales bacterium]